MIFADDAKECHGRHCQMRPTDQAEPAPITLRCPVTAERPT
jgi:hypothetical protein